MDCPKDEVYARFSCVDLSVLLCKLEVSSRWFQCSKIMSLKEIIASQPGRKHCETGVLTEFGQTRP
jgi:hypothetical protein